MTAAAVTTVRAYNATTNTTATPAFADNAVKEDWLTVQILCSIDKQCAICFTAPMTVVHVTKDVHFWPYL